MAWVDPGLNSYSRRIYRGQSQLPLGAHRDHAFTIVPLPGGPVKTTGKIHIYDATDDRKQWKLVFKEDIFVVQGMQRGRAAPDFGSHRFSPVMDNPTRLGDQKNDRAALITLHTMAADHSAKVQAKRFYLPHAYVYVFTLETDYPDVPALRHHL